MNFRDTEFKKQAIQNFKDTVKILRELKIPFFLSNGTLLGCIRGNDLISHDSDMDFGIFIEDLKDKEQEIIKKFKDLGFTHHATYGTKRDGFELTFRRIGKLDLFFYYHEEKGDTMSVVGNRRIKYLYPRLNILISKEFLGETVFIPYNYEEYLTAQYGDWKTPVEIWNYMSSIKNGYEE